MRDLSRNIYRLFWRKTRFTFKLDFNPTTMYMWHILDVLSNFILLYSMLLLDEMIMYFFQNVQRLQKLKGSEKNYLKRRRLSLYLYFPISSFPLPLSLSLSLPLPLFSQHSFSLFPFPLFPSFSLSLSFLAYKLPTYLLEGQRGVWVCWLWGKKWLARVWLLLTLGLIRW